MENTQTCQNCRYFAAHYVKLARGYFSCTGNCGHCTNENLPFQRPQIIAKRHLECEYWEPLQIQIDERRKNIIDFLYKMAERIEEIACILKDDNDCK